MRIGTKKKSKKKDVEAVMSRTVKQKNVGSPAFDVDDPIQRLMFTIGSGFFNESRYYDSLQPADENGHHVSVVTEETYKGREIVRPQNVTDQSGLIGEGRELLETMREIAESENHEDLLILARWAREDLNLRQTAVMAVAVAAEAEARLKRGSGNVRRYTPHILLRADEPKRAFAAYRQLYMPRDGGNRSKSTFPHGFARGLIAALQRFNEYQFLKYDSQREKPTFSELFRFLVRYEGRGKGRSRRRNMRPASKALMDYFISGKVDEKALPKLAAREKLYRRTEFDAGSQLLALEADVTWENLTSHFGSTNTVWRWLVQNKKLPYMALLRNLRNLEQADLDDETWDMVYNYLTSDVNHRQMPFRFLAARRETRGQHAISAIDVALDKSVKNVPDLKGKTFIMVDSSGSMTSALSSKSKMTCKDAGYAMAAILAKKLGRNAIVGVFGASFAVVPISEADSVMTIIGNLERVGNTVGHATEAWLAVNWLLGRKLTPSQTDRWGYRAGGSYAKGSSPKGPINVDRIVVVSDMNCYDSYGNENLPRLLEEYRRDVNEDTFYYSVNVGGGGQAKMDPQNDHTLLMSGFSEKIFSLFRSFEEKVVAEDKSVEQREIPTMADLREKFRVE